MISVSPSPWPEAAEPAALAIDARPDGVAVVRLDAPGVLASALSPAFAAQLTAAADRVERDPSVAAVVVAIGPSDDAGIDLDLVTSLKFAGDAERMARGAASTLRRLEDLKKPVVAALRGRVAGGRLEIALACRAVVASDDVATAVRISELRVGLVPAANGLIRAARRAGLRTALELALDEKEWSAREALDRGLVDEVCPDPLLFDVAARLARSAALRPQPRRRAARAVDRTPIGRATVFRGARARAAAAAGRGPASMRAVDVLERYARKGFDAAADLEARAFGELVVSETAHRLAGLWRGIEELRFDRFGDRAVEPRPVSFAGVIGGGAIGSGVALVTIEAGVPVRLKELDDVAAGRALRRVYDRLPGDGAERGRKMWTVSASSDWSGLRHADIVVEAVFEDVALKRAVVRELESRVAPTCVLASATSSIPIARIAEEASAPERVLGMHYFGPVERTRLLEVVRARRTDARAVATAVALGRRQGKTVIVVDDGPGFYTTRVLAPLLSEALHMVGEGVAADVVDRALVDWGFSVGPLRLLDEIGIDVADRVARSLHEAFGERMAPPGALARLLGDERRGRKNRRGIYRYDERSPQGDARAVDSRVYALLDVRPTRMLPVEDIQMRAVLAMVHEAMRAFGDRVVRSPRDADVGAVLGLGFPAFRGGPLRYVDTIGAPELLRRVQGYADRFGERWRPTPLLVQMAKKGERFYA